MTGRRAGMDSIALADLQAHWVDIAMLAWLALSLLVGVARGLVFETVSLVGWGAAYFGAHWALPWLAPHLPVGEPGSALNLAAAFLCAFIAVLLAWSLAARLVRLLVRATPLSLPDRVLGAGFGVLRGVVVLMVLASVVALTPLAASVAWRHSHCAAWLNEALHGLKPWLPNELSPYLPS